MKLPSWQNFRKYLSIATDIVDKLPNRNDGPIKVVVKLLAILDSFDKKLGKQSALNEFFGKVSASPRRNRQFVDLFFSTELKSAFDVTRLAISDYSDIVIADGGKLGTLYFIVYTWNGRQDPLNEFWHSKDFDFEGTLQHLWECFGNGLQIGLSFENGLDSPKTTYEEIKFTEDPLIGSANATLESLVTTHKQYAADGFSQTYMFVGKQGVGKSTFATRMAQRCGKRTLLLNAQGLTVTGTNDMGFLVKGLAPDFLIVDDLDRISEIATSVPMLLGSLSNLKARYPKTTVILTVNNITVFDPAILRPGRVDSIVEFEDPNAKERDVLLQGYLKEFGARCRNRRVFVKELEGLTAAYIRDVALKLKYKPESEVLATIRQAKRLTAKKEAKKDEGKTATPDTCTKAPS